MRMLLPALVGAFSIAAPSIVAPAFAAPAPAWTVDKAASKLGFTASMNGQAFNGSFRNWIARIAFDPKNLAGSSVVAVIETGSVVTGDPTRDESLPTEDWFSTKLFPQATFVARKFKDLGGGKYQAIGELTLRGVKRPAILPFQLAITGPVAKVQGGLDIDRTSFGVGQGQWTTGESVATKVHVTLNLTAKRAK